MNKSSSHVKDRDDDEWMKELIDTSTKSLFSTKVTRSVTISRSQSERYLLLNIIYYLLLLLTKIICIYCLLTC
jgi:hypothetical protein